LLPKKVENGIKYAEYVLTGISGLCFVAMMFLGTADVIGRYVFNSPITGTYEISQVLMAGVVLLGWAYTMKTGGHVRVELLICRLPSRPRAIIDFVMMLLSLAIFIMIMWRSTLLALQYMEEHRVLQTLNIPVYPFFFLVPVGAFFLCLEIIIQMIYLIPAFRRSV
jgi:TRAP-type C4-dicarboxylate transport system permease small subunit